MVDPRGSAPVAQDSEVHDVPVGVFRTGAGGQDWETLALPSTDGENMVVTAGKQERAQTGEAWARHLNGQTGC